MLETFSDPYLYRRAVDDYARAHLGDCHHLFSAIHTLTPEIMLRRQSWLGRLHRNGSTSGIVLINSLLPARVASMSDLEADETDLVAEAFRQHGIKPSALMGPQRVVEALAENLIQQGAATVSERVRLGSHMLTTEPVTPACAGNWRIATPSDIELLFQWESAFVVECELPDIRQDLYREITERLESPTALCWLWEVDGRSVATALGRCLPPVGRVGVVYTDPMERGYGYAGALVAQLSMQLLANGCKAVFLFTDMSNPVSNGVYRRIGYCLAGEQIELQLGWSS